MSRIRVKWDELRNKTTITESTSIFGFIPNWRPQGGFVYPLMIKGVRSTPPWVWLRSVCGSHPFKEGRVLFINKGKSSPFDHLQWKTGRSTTWYHQLHDCTVQELWINVPWDKTLDKWLLLLLARKPHLALPFKQLKPKTDNLFSKKQFIGYDIQAQCW